MKLDHDCVRDVMLFFEDNLRYGDCLPINEISLKKHAAVDICYTVKKLLEAGFLAGDISYGDNEAEIVISEMTWEGHRFLDTIRDNVVWSKTKGFLSKFASVSLSFTADVASQVIANMFTQYIQSQPQMF